MSRKRVIVLLLAAACAVTLPAVVGARTAHTLLGATTPRGVTGTTGPVQLTVEVNGDILERERYGACTLQEGDTIEIVRMVGGGAGRRRLGSR